MTDEEAMPQRLSDIEETKEENGEPMRYRSTLERLHLGFIARLIGRDYASDEEEIKRQSRIEEQLTTANNTALKKKK